MLQQQHQAAGAGDDEQADADHRRREHAREQRRGETVEPLERHRPFDDHDPTDRQGDSPSSNELFLTKKSTV